MLRKVVASPRGHSEAGHFNGLGTGLPTTPVIEDQGLSLVTSNCFGSDQAKERAAAAGPRNGSETSCEVAELPRDYTADEPASATPMCVTCKWARPFPEVEGSTWGAALQTRIPAFVRLCQLHSQRNMVQLVNTFWRCGQWEGRS